MLGLPWGFVVHNGDEKSKTGREGALIQKPKEPELESGRNSDSVRSNFRSWAGIVRVSMSEVYKAINRKI